MSFARKDADLKLSAARMWEASKPWITAEERAEAEKKVCDFVGMCVRYCVVGRVCVCVCVC